MANVVCEGLKKCSLVCMREKLRWSVWQVRGDQGSQFGEGVIWVVNVVREESRKSHE